MVVWANRQLEHDILYNLQTDKKTKMPHELLQFLGKPHTLWVKIITGGLVKEIFAADGQIARDHQRSVRGAFSTNLGKSNILRAELLTIMITLEEANCRGLSNV